MVAVGHNDITNIKARKRGARFSHQNMLNKTFTWDIDLLLRKKNYDNFL